MYIGNKHHKELIEMNQQRLKAYLSLIQELLSCPRGEEWISLKKHQELVNPELVQVMEEVASQLGAEGNLEAAKFLHNWAGKLYHILSQPIKQSSENDQSQAYLNLIQALLDCPEGREQELLAANQELIDPGLVKTMRQVATKLEDQGDYDTAHYLGQWAAQLNKIWLATHGFQANLAQKEDQDRKKPLVSPDKSPEKSNGNDLTDAGTNIAPQNEQKQATEGKITEEITDPWADMSSSPSPVESTPSEDTSISESSSESSAEPITADEPITNAVYQQINQNLTAIATSLATLNEHLAQQSLSQNPLWYMEVLERAQTSNWLLATEEVEKLIGVKPVCHGDESIFERGCWIFVKVGKIGAQTAWRVTKKNE